MDDRSTRKSRDASHLMRSALAFFLAFALAFMAFDANLLQTAYAQPDEMQVEDDADNGDQPVGDAVVDEADGDADEAEPKEASNADETKTTEPTEDANGARDGPQDEEGGDAPAKFANRAVEEASCTVTFYSNASGQASAILKRILVKAPAGQTQTVDLDAVTADAPSADQVFVGWNFRGATTTGAVEVDPLLGDVQLYPVFASGHWVRFVPDAASGEASYVASIFVAATDEAPASLPVSSRAGYAFEGWFEGSQAGGEVEYLGRVADSAGAVVDDQLKQKLLAADVTLYAQWSALPVEYRVIMWHENPDDDGYSYEGVEVIGDDEGEHAVSGEMTAVEDLPEVPGFTVSQVDQRQIAGDGSTLVNAYYQRNTYKVLFHQERSDTSDVFSELTIEAKYGADIRERWPQVDDSLGRYTTSWYTETDPESNVFVTGIGTMPLNGAHFYPKLDKGLLASTVYLVQAVDGSDTYSEYVSIPFTTENSPWTTADDYMPIKGFMVNAASEADAELIRKNAVGDDLATHKDGYRQSAPISAKYEEADEVEDAFGVMRHTLYFYYLRCQYDIVFEENGGADVPDATRIYYQASLEGRAPAAYVEGETTKITTNGMTYTFAGWYDNELFTGEKYDFSGKTMPAGNMVLYAKWDPSHHLVQVDPAGGVFSDPGQSTFFWVKHGQPIGYIGVERNYVLDESGDYVYVYEAYDPQDPEDDFGSAEYVEADEQAQGERYSRQEGLYSLYGWYLAGADIATDQSYDLNAPVISDTSIVAKWRSAGVFDIAYNPVYRDGEVTVSGDIDTRLDDGYADLSPTFVLNTPEPVEASNGEEYRFVGWQVVSGYGQSDTVLDDTLYQQGDGFIVDSELARNNIIHLQAVYEQIPDPVEPADPVDPNDPVDPSGPDSPTDPSDPTDPVVPSGPSDSTDPSSPLDPSAPSSPTDPEVTVVPESTDESTAIQTPEDDGNSASTEEGTTEDEDEGDAGGLDIIVIGEESASDSDEEASVLYGGAGDGDAQQAAKASESMPKTGDDVRSLAILIAAISIACLTVALVARALRKQQEADRES